MWEKDAAAAADAAAVDDDGIYGDTIISQFIMYHVEVERYGREMDYELML